MADQAAELEALYRRRVDLHVSEGMAELQARGLASFEVYGGDAILNGKPEGDPRILEAKKITGDA